MSSNNEWRVEVQSASVDERSGKVRNGPRSGEDYSIRQQEAWLHSGHAYPERFVVNLGDRKAYAPGMYAIGPGSVEVGEYKRLQFSRDLNLIPIADSPKLAAAR